MSSMDHPQPALPAHTEPEKSPPEERHEASHKQKGVRPPRALLFLFIAVVLGLLVLGALPRLTRQATLSHDTREVRATIPSVNVLSPVRVNEGSITLPSSLQGGKETVIQARASGYVRQFYVDIGSRVRAGQLLADIESPEMDQQTAQADAQAAQAQAAVQQARSGVASSQARLSQMQAAVGQAVAGVAHAQQALDAKRAALLQTQAVVAQSNANFLRMRSLLGPGYVARQEVEQALTQLRTDKASVTSAQADVKAAQADVVAAQKAVTSAQEVVNSTRADVQASKQNVQAEQSAALASQANARRYQTLSAYQKVVAPFSGVITSRNVDVGSLIAAGGGSSSGSSTSTGSGSSTTPQTGLFGLAQTGQVRVQVNVPETFAASVRSGSRAAVMVRALPGQEFPGTVNLRSGALDAESRTLLVEVLLQNPDGVLVPGMYADVRLTPEHPASSLHVPGTALIIDADGSRVAVVGTDDHVQFQDVRIGRDFGNEVEVLSGLRDGQKLVDNPSALLKSGDPVKVQSDEGTTWADEDRKGGSGGGGGKGNGAGGSRRRGAKGAAGRSAAGG